MGRRAVRDVPLDPGARRRTGVDRAPESSKCAHEAAHARRARRFFSRVLVFSFFTLLPRDFTCRHAVAATPSPRDFTPSPRLVVSVLHTGGDWGLFGLHTVSDDASELVITEGEYDAMAVYQATGRAAVSLPNGAASLPPAVLPLLERFKRIFLWCDGDEVPARRPSPVFLWSGGVGWGGTTRSGATTGTPSPRPVRTCGRGAHEPAADLGERPPHAIDV